MKQPDNSLLWYTREVGSHYLLTAEEERALALRIMKGDETAKKRLIACNLRLVVEIAGRYAGATSKSPVISMADLVQEGNIGLVRAAETFDGTRGVRFATFASFQIKRHIMQAIMKQSRNLRIPTRAFVMANKYNNIIDEFWVNHGRRPTDAEIAQIMDMTVGRLRKFKNDYNHILPPKENTDEDNEHPPDTFANLSDNTAPTPEDEAVQKMQNDNIVSVVGKTLTDKQKKILYERIGLNEDGRGKTLQEIGAELGYSAERIRQIEKEIYRKLKKLDFKKLGYKIQPPKITKENS